jgi:hypothetical protein
MLRKSLRFVPISLLAVALALIVMSVPTPSAPPSPPQVAPETLPCPACGVVPPWWLFPGQPFELPVEWTFG